MAFTDEEIAQYGDSAAAFCQRRIPVPTQDGPWMGFRIEGQSIILLEFRPHWQNKSLLVQSPIAKTTFVRRTDEWRIYRMRADLKWHGYAPCPAVASFEEFLEEVDRDEYCCFFG
ncbi:MAG TPA: DUF3024 domain-containing protein [Acidobacteriota bacterium]|nr:DUF3024 domain-containing protein [Acidobacteriota bacterium]